MNAARRIRRSPRPPAPCILPALALLAVLGALFSCRTAPTLRVQAPSGFAEEEGREVYRAVSPEGLLYRVRTVANSPRKDLSFWSEALRHHLSQEGYRAIGGQQRFSGAGEGVFYEWAIPYGNQDAIYLTALLVFGDRIVIAEAGGEHTVYREYREKLIESLESIRLGS